MKDENRMLSAYELEIMRAILADNGLDSDWLYKLIQDFFPANVTPNDFRDMLNRKKTIHSYRKIWLWLQLRKICSDMELIAVDYFIQQNLIRFNNFVLHPHRRKPKRSAFDRLKNGQYAFLAEGYSDIDSVE